MHNYFLDPLDRLESSLNQMFSALNQYLDTHIIRNHLPFNQLPEKIVLNLGSCGKTYFDLDLLEAQLHQHIEKFNFLFNNHRLDQSLIAIPQIYAAPYRCLHDLLAGPFSLWIIDNWYSFIPFKI